MPCKYKNTRLTKKGLAKMQNDKSKSKYKCEDNQKVLSVTIRETFTAALISIAEDHSLTDKEKVARHKIVSELMVKVNEQVAEHQTEVKNNTQDLWRLANNFNKLSSL